MSWRFFTTASMFCITLINHMYFSLSTTQYTTNGRFVSVRYTTCKCRTPHLKRDNGAERYWDGFCATNATLNTVTEFK